MSTFTRRGFLKLAGTGAAVAAAGLVIPAWVKGATTHFLPPGGGWHQALKVRKVQQYLINTDSFVTRYDATWDLPNGEGRQFHVDTDRPYFGENAKYDDDIAISLLTDRLRAEGGVPNSEQFKLQLPCSAYVPAKFIYA